LFANPKEYITKHSVFNTLRLIYIYKSLILSSIMGIDTNKVGQPAHSGNRKALNKQLKDGKVHM